MIFEVGDRVVCVDGKVQQSLVGDPQDNFSFPNGFVVEGSYYIVCGIMVGGGGSQILQIEGYPVYLWTGDLHGWHHLRFRKIESATEAAVADATSQAEAEEVTELPVETH